MSITTHDQDESGTLALEDQLHLWGATQALSPERAAQLHNVILAAAREADEELNATDDMPWLTSWLVREMAALRLGLQRSLSLDSVLAACGPESLRAAIGPLPGA